jgi:hypothetical protein
MYMGEGQETMPVSWSNRPRAHRWTKVWALVDLGIGASAMMSKAIARKLLNELRWTSVSMLTLLAPAMANAAEWRTVLNFVAGNVTNCTASYYDKYTVVEDSNTLFLRSQNKRVLFLTVPLKPDGSAVVEAQMLQIGGSQAVPVRVKVPAGSGRRSFELLYIKNVCTMRADPI